MRRVNESLRAVLAESLGELKDPRIGFVTVTGVDTTPDLRQATVYVSVLGSERKRERASWASCPKICCAAWGGCPPRSTNEA